MKRRVTSATLTTLLTACLGIFVNSGDVEAQGNDFSFTNSFSADNDILLVDFSLDADATVTLTTLSYAGGINANGETVSPGGFDPILTLFDSDRNFITSNDDGTPPDVNIDPISNLSYDPFLEIDLSAGNYTAAVTQFDNFFTGFTGDNISLGFIRDGEPDFTTEFGPAPFFNDVSGFARTGNWAIDTLNVTSATVVSVPEPSSLLILGISIAAMATQRRRTTTRT